MTFCSMTVC